jgi:hypothetical protein
MPDDITPDTVPTVEPTGTAVKAADRGGQIPG